MEICDAMLIKFVLFHKKKKKKTFQISIINDRLSLNSIGISIIDNVGKCGFECAKVHYPLI